MNATEDPATPEPDLDAVSNAHEHDSDGTKSDVEDDPAHEAGEDEGWTAEGGATPSGPATDVDSET